MAWAGEGRPCLAEGGVKSSEDILDQNENDNGSGLYNFPEQGHQYTAGILSVRAETFFPLFFTTGRNSLPIL